MNPIYRCVALAFLAFLTCMPDALADGKMFVRETVPTTIPYQRAIILHAEDTQTLVLQSQYQVPETSDTHTIGWVVPVPATPEVATVDVNNGKWAFAMLDRTTRPYITRYGDQFWTVLLYASIGSIIVCLIGTCFSSGKFSNRWLVGEFVSMAATVCIFNFPIRQRVARAKFPVEVETLKSQQAGIYDVKVIRAKAAADVLAWLNENAFRFGPEDESAIQGYLDRGWVFTVAKIRPSTPPPAPSRFSEGLADPLILRFPATNPIYPLALTATGGHDTEVLIYLASDIPRTGDGRLPLRYAGKGLPAGALCDLMPAQDEGFGTNDELSGKSPFTRLAKFKGTLTPDQMRKDLEFLPDPKQTAYREHIYRW
ncbi:MAG: DUF2330 domain-containing protein [Verrucomicrobia bacterium]|nr:DUF2330 domain-containing protein [Verrucomicrobiota bacterium]